MAEHDRDDRRESRSTPRRVSRTGSGRDESWLLRLRWWEIATQAAILLVAWRWFEVALPAASVVALLAVEATSNVLAAWWLRRRRSAPPAALTAALLALDVLSLTVLLHLTGGAYNPFTFLYLVHIALAAVVLPPRWTWSLALLSLASFGALFLLGGGSEHAAHFRSHVQGMWAAFGVAAAFIVIFVTRVARALSRRDAELARSARLASLATLAAGAAHELSTPLGTIAIAARELDRRLERLGDAPAREDAALIRAEVERCRVILEQLASDAGQAHGAASGPVTVRELLDLATDGRSLEREVPADVEARLVSVPLRPLGRALRGLVENAVHAAGAAVSVRCAVVDHELTIEIADRGPGMSDEVLARAGEPFFTTREAGSGMGLGIFLARSVLERVGGRLDLTSRPGHGTRAVATIPLAEPA